MSQKTSSVFKKVAIVELILLILFGGYYSFYYLPSCQKNSQPAISVPTQPPLPTVTLAPTPTSQPVPTVFPATVTQTYSDPKYGFKFSYPSSWSLTKTKNDSFSLEVVKIISPDKKSQFEVDVREGIWSDIKLELRDGYKNTTFAGQPTLLKGNVYTVKSTVKGEVLQITTTGPSIPKILSSFKFR